ncbi:MucBP-like protein [Breznakia blatticola]|uniref:MucBP-like protein n=2 Tax=Breznakia blatticola TaxID=1754012 RepID=A0A4R7ZIK3_9FIRM|nr:MucBP-like protein [Breznakia blatticola]
MFYNIHNKKWKFIGLIAAVAMMITTVSTTVLAKDTTNQTNRLNIQNNLVEVSATEESFEEWMPDPYLRTITKQNLGLDSENPNEVVTKEMLENYSEDRFSIGGTSPDQIVYNTKGLEYLPDTVTIEYISQYYWGGTHEYNFEPIANNPVYLHLYPISNSGNYEGIVPLLKDSNTFTIELSGAPTAEDDPIVPTAPIYVEDMHEFSIPIEQLFILGSADAYDLFTWNNANYMIYVGDYALTYIVTFNETTNAYDFKVNEEISEEEYEQALAEYTKQKQDGTYSYMYGGMNASFSTPFISSGSLITYPDIRLANEGEPVTIKYQDTDGQAIIDDIQLEGNIGETYTSEQKTFAGYTFKEVIGNPQGSFSDEAQTVTYVYTKDVVAGMPVTVKYQDTDGNVIAKEDILQGNIGESYTTSQKQIPGYTYKEVIGNQNGTFSDQAQTIIYVYTKDIVVHDTPINGNTNSDSDIPKTGDTSIPTELLLALAFGSVVVIGIIFYKKTKQNKK